MELETRIWGDTASNSVQIYAREKDPVKLDCGHTRHPEASTGKNEHGTLDRRTADSGKVNVAAASGYLFLQWILCNPYCFLSLLSDLSLWRVCLVGKV